MNLGKHFLIMRSTDYLYNAAENQVENYILTIISNRIVHEVILKTSIIDRQILIRVFGE